MRKIFILVLTLAMLFVVSSGAWAFTILDISQSAFNTLAGSEITLPSNSTVISGLAGRFTATLLYKVYYNDTSELYTYAYQLANSSLSLDPISRLTITNPGEKQVYNMPGGSPSTDSYGYITDTSLVAPTGFSNNSTFTSYFGYQFTDSNDSAILHQGDTSNWMYVRYYDPPTRATANVQNGEVGAGPTVGPAVPEPGSMLLLGMGILGLFGLGRRKA